MLNRTGKLKGFVAIYMCYPSQKQQQQKKLNRNTINTELKVTVPKPLKSGNTMQYTQHLIVSVSQVQYRSFTRKREAVISLLNIVI